MVRCFAYLQGSIAACEFLLQNGAKIDNKDVHGQTALHLATSLCNTGYDYCKIRLVLISINSAVQPDASS